MQVAGQTRDHRRPPTLLLLALDFFVEGYRPFVLQQMDARHSGKGEAKCREYLSQQSRPGAPVVASPPRPVPPDEDSAARLSSREQQVALHVGMGRTNKEIARSLGMTEHTVKFHLRNIFAKLGVDRRAHVQSRFASQGSPPR